MKASIAPTLKQEVDGRRVTALSLGHQLETAKATVTEAKQVLQVLHAIRPYAKPELLGTNRLAWERRAAALEAVKKRPKNKPQLAAGEGY